MSIHDLKLYTINTLTMAVTFTNIEATLKLVLLLASIGYTLQRWYIMNEQKEKQKVNGRFKNRFRPMG